MKNAMGREICSFIATVFCLSQHFTVKAMAVAYAFFKRHSTTIAILYQINNWVKKDISAATMVYLKKYVENRPIVTEDMVI